MLRDHYRIGPTATILMKTKWLLVLAHYKTNSKRMLDTALIFTTKTCIYHHR